MNKRDSTKIHIANVRLALVGTSIPMCANIFYIFMYFKQTNEQMNEEVEVYRISRNGVERTYRRAYFARYVLMR